MDKQEFNTIEKFLKDVLNYIINELHKPNFFTAEKYTKVFIKELNRLLKIFIKIKLGLNSENNSNSGEKEKRLGLQIIKILAIIEDVCDPDEELPYPIPPKVNLDLCIELKEDFYSLLKGETLYGRNYNSESAKRTKRHLRYVKKHPEDKIKLGTNLAHSKKSKRKRKIKRKRRTILKKKK